MIWDNKMTRTMHGDNDTDNQMITMMSYGNDKKKCPENAVQLSEGRPGIGGRDLQQLFRP